MVKRNLALARPRWHAPVEAVEALETRPEPVVTIRRLAVEQEVAGKLQLVRGVVREEPRCRRVTERHLERDGRHDERREHSDTRQDHDDARERPGHAQHEGEHHDADPSQHRRRPEQSEIPLSAGESHEERQRP